MAAAPHVGRCCQRRFPHNQSLKPTAWVAVGLFAFALYCPQAQTAFVTVHGVPK